MLISLETPGRQDVRELLAEHLAEMHSTSPAESVHALDLSALSVPEITFWTARDGETLLGCGALKRLSEAAGEIKSMRTTSKARGRGVAGAVLEGIVAEATARGYRDLYLETGVEDYFAPARRLYQKFGFVECQPFADYRPDPNSVFMVRRLSGIAV
ncbi:GNAT family N-acetyltransferase [Psychromicrobium sp. YIM B11713]|uniref:GNAT family N-acetyltransferase n=1 Tax=Psychromicrobium sp. YIM B11713 TaxID=3145233 RepID=UPI00374E354F